MTENELKENDSIIFGPNWYIIPSTIEERENIRKIQRTKYSDEKECTYCHQKFDYGYSSLKSYRSCHIFVKCSTCNNYFELNFNNYSGTDQKRINNAILNKSELTLYCSKECKTEGTKKGLKKFHEENPDAAKEWVENSKNIKFCPICNKNTIHRGDDCTVCHGKHAIKEMQKYAVEHPDEEKEHRQKCAESLNNWWNERPEERTENAINNISKWNNSEEGKEFNTNNCREIGLIYGGDHKETKIVYKFCNNCNLNTPHIKIKGDLKCEVCLGIKIYDKINNKFYMKNKYDKIIEKRNERKYKINLIKSYNLDPSYINYYESQSRKENISFEEFILNESIKENDKNNEKNKILNEIYNNYKLTDEDKQYIISNLSYNYLNYKALIKETEKLNYNKEILKKYNFKESNLIYFDRKSKKLNMTFENLVKITKKNNDNKEKEYQEMINILKKYNFEESYLNYFKRLLNLYNISNKNNCNNNLYYFEKICKEKREEINKNEEEKAKKLYLLKKYNLSENDFRSVISYCFIRNITFEKACKLKKSILED